MKKGTMRYGIGAGVLWILLAVIGMGQESAAAGAGNAPAQAKNGIRQAIRWEQIDYTCESGVKLTVYLHNQTAKVRYQDGLYLMRQTEPAGGGRYSNGKVVWWGTGNAGFLQEDTPDGGGKMILKDCQLDKPLKGETAAVTGMVRCLQRTALPADAVIDVQFQELSVVDAPAKIIAEKKIMLGNCHMPVPFELRFDPAKLDPHSSYSINARILVDGQVRFRENYSYGILDSSGYPLYVNMIVKPIAAGSPN